MAVAGWAAIWSAWECFGARRKCASNHGCLGLSRKPVGSRSVSTVAAIVLLRPPRLSQRVCLFGYPFCTGTVLVGVRRQRRSLHKLCQRPALKPQTFLAIRRCDTIANVRCVPHENSQSEQAGATKEYLHDNGRALHIYTAGLSRRQVGRLPRSCAGLTQWYLVDSAL